MAGKSPDQLNLDDEPLPKLNQPATSRDVRAEPWYIFAREIDDLLATGHYEWAVETLMGIQETVERSRNVTEGQRKAVENIEAGRQRPKRGYNRRYENFSRRYQ